MKQYLLSCVFKKLKQPYYKMMKSIKYTLIICIVLCSCKYSYAATENCVVIGSGVGGITAALYLARAGLNPIIIEGETPGGLLTKSHKVQNWPGELEITGLSLTKRMREQAIANGAIFLQEKVTAVSFTSYPYEITTKSFGKSDKTKKIKAKSIIIAMGTTPNYLNIPGEKEYWGYGVSNCVECDGPLYKGQIVGVVGGGDAAVLETLLLSTIAKEVHVFVRKKEFHINDSKMLDNLLRFNNVILHFNTEVTAINGNENINSVTLVNNVTKNSCVFNLAALFITIGSKPNSSIFMNCLELNPKGYILIDNYQATKIKGVYAIGDITDPVYKQAVTASGDGAKAALQVYKFLLENNLISITSTTSNSVNKPEEAKYFVLEINSLEQFNAELLNSHYPIVVDFYATWCGPCKRIAPVIVNFARNLNGRVKFLKVDVDKIKILAEMYEIKALPTVILFDKLGNAIERVTGTDGITVLLKNIEKDSSLYTIR